MPIDAATALSTSHRPPAASGCWRARACPQLIITASSHLQPLIVAHSTQVTQFACHFVRLHIHTPHIPGTGGHDEHKRYSLHCAR
eukprot:scaffold20145_cov103-Isochrysis_galbana.AAC.3